MLPPRGSFPNQQQQNRLGPSTPTLMQKVHRQNVINSAAAVNSAAEASSVSSSNVVYDPNANARGSGAVSGVAPYGNAFQNMGLRQNPMRHPSMYIVGRRIQLERYLKRFAPVGVMPEMDKRPRVPVLHKQKPSSPSKKQPVNVVMGGTVSYFLLGGWGGPSKVFARICWGRIFRSDLWAWQRAIQCTRGS